MSLEKYQRQAQFIGMGGTWGMEISDGVLSGTGQLGDAEISRLENLYEGDEKGFAEAVNSVLLDVNPHMTTIGEQFRWADLTHWDAAEVTFSILSVYQGDSSHLRNALAAPLICRQAEIQIENPGARKLTMMGTDAAHIYTGLIDPFYFDSKSAPIINSGADKSRSEDNSDAPEQVQSLFETLNHSVDSGVHWSWLGHLYSGGDLIKWNPTEVGMAINGSVPTFLAPHGTNKEINTLPPFQVLDYEIPRGHILRSLDWESVLTAMNQVVVVDLSYANDVKDEARRILSDKYSAVIVLGLGLGNINNPTRKVVAEAAKLGKNVFISSSVPAPSVETRYAVAGLSINNEELANSNTMILNPGRVGVYAIRGLAARSVLEGRSQKETQELIDIYAGERDLL